MKNFKRIITLCLALVLCLSCVPAAFAAEVADATIDESRKGSLTIYKYDLTNAEKDGVWDSSYVSTGVMDQSGVVDVLGGNRAGDTDNKSDLGNGEASYGYAIKGVEFSYVKIASIVQFSESTADGRTDNHVEVLYGIDKVKGADFLKALGLENSAKRYTNADHLNENYDSIVEEYINDKSGQELSRIYKEISADVTFYPIYETLDRESIRMN